MPTLQEQINATPSGETLTLADGSEHIGNFTFPRSVKVQGKGTLITPNVGPAIDIPLKARDITFTDTRVKCSGPMVYDLVKIGAWQNTVLADCPTNITFDRVDIFGVPGQEVQRGIRGDGANIQVLNSQIREIHGKGYDTQAFFAANGPGPFKLIDCYLEASGENVMFGGSDAKILNLVPSDIEIRRCKLFKPLAWRGVWTVKNLLELKNARRVVIDGNVLENCWGDAQIGFGVLFTVRNQDGTNPWAVVEDVQFTNNSLLNVAGGFQLLGSDNLKPSQQSSRLRIANNLIRLAQKGALGPNGRLLQLQIFHDVTFENNDCDPDHTILLLAGSQPVQRLVYRKNVSTLGQYGARHDAGTSEKKALDTFAPGYDFSSNLLTTAANVTSLYPIGNTFSATRPDPLPSGVGVDMAALTAAQGKPAITPPPPPHPPPPPPLEPSPDGTKGVKIIDSQLAIWTIGSQLQTLRNGAHVGSGFGTEYKYLAQAVYVHGTDAAKNWFKWTGSGWIGVGVHEPGTTPPSPTTRSVPYPSQPSQRAKRNEILQAQRRERFYLVLEGDGTATFEKL